MGKKYKVIDGAPMFHNKEEFKPSKILVEKVITFFYKGGQYTAKAIKRGDSHYRVLEGLWKGHEIHVMKLVH